MRRSAEQVAPVGHRLVTTPSRSGILDHGSTHAERPRGSLPYRTTYRRSSRAFAHRGEHTTAFPCNERIPRRRRFRSASATPMAHSEQRQGSPAGRTLSFRCRIRAHHSRVHRSWRAREHSGEQVFTLGAKRRRPFAARSRATRAMDFPHSLQRRAGTLPIVAVRPSDTESRFRSVGILSRFA
jgi:hypothetical protein